MGVLSIIYVYGSFFFFLTYMSNTFFCFKILLAKSLIDMVKYDEDYSNYYERISEDIPILSLNIKLYIVIGVLNCLIDLNWQMILQRK